MTVKTISGLSELTKELFDEFQRQLSVLKGETLSADKALFTLLTEYPKAMKTISDFDRMNREKLESVFKETEK